MFPLSMFQDNSNSKDAKHMYIGNISIYDWVLYRYADYSNYSVA